MANTVPVSAEGYPLYIPADDGGTWNLVQGSTCPVQSIPAVLPTVPAIVTPIPGGKELII